MNSSLSHYRFYLLGDQMNVYILGGGDIIAKAYGTFETACRELVRQEAFLLYLLQQSLNSLLLFKKFLIYCIVNH